jgi:transposase
MEDKCGTSTPEDELDLPTTAGDHLHTPAKAGGRPAAGAATRSAAAAPAFQTGDHLLPLSVAMLVFALPGQRIAAAPRWRERAPG